MKRSALLLCSLAVFLGCSDDSDDLNCGSGTVRDGDLCVPIICDTGTVLDGNDCVAIVCDTGFELEGNHCVPIVCETGFELDGNDCVAIVCDTGFGLQGNDCVPIVCEEGFRLEGNDCVAFSCETGYVVQGNECVDVDECAPPVVTFAKAPYSSEQDCITPEVCITRGDQRSIYNAVAVDFEDAVCGSGAPTGTLWARGACDQATAEDFGPFLSDAFATCSPPSVVSTPGCVWLVGSEGPGDDRFFEIEFSDWGAGGTGGTFAYARREAICGAGFTCVNEPGTYTCECPAGYTFQDDACVDVDECAADTDGCDASATCENLAGGFRCACAGPLSFEKTAGGTERDCITPDVCLTRGNQFPIYNAVQDDPPTSTVSRFNPIPTGTLWAYGACANARASQFGTFLSDFYTSRSAPDIGVASCLKIGDVRFDLTFTSWAAGPDGGGAFSYDRSNLVAPGVACPASPPTP